MVLILTVKLGTMHFLNRQKKLDSSTFVAALKWLHPVGVAFCCLWQSFAN